MNMYSHTGFRVPMSAFWVHEDLCPEVSVEGAPQSCSRHRRWWLSSVGQIPTEQTNSCWVTVTHATRMILVRHCEYTSNRLTTVFITFTGSKTLKFFTLAEFHLWREREEATYTTYVKGQQTYHPYGTRMYPTPLQHSLKNVLFITCRHILSRYYLAE